MIMQNCLYNDQIIKKADLFAEKMNIYSLIYLSGVLQPLDALSRFERNLQDYFSENLNPS